MDEIKQYVENAITDGDSAVIQAHCHSSKGYETRFGMYRIQRTINRSCNDFVKYI